MRGWTNNETVMPICFFRKVTTFYRGNLRDFHRVQTSGYCKAELDSHQRSRGKQFSLYPRESAPREIQISIRRTTARTLSLPPAADPHQFRPVERLNASIRFECIRKGVLIDRHFTVPGSWKVRPLSAAPLLTFSNLEASLFSPSRTGRSINEGMRFMRYGRSFSVTTLKFGALL